jgi:hypothetical protein
MSVTGDWVKLHAAWQETQVLPCATLEGLVAESTDRHRGVVEMAERMRFSAWINSLRDLVERREAAIEEATGEWMKLLRERGIVEPEKEVLA